MCNHVLEHVPYDNAALNELLRVTKDDGFVFLTVPAPLAIERTNDWGYPRKEQHGHYRLYGKDFVNILKKYLPAAWILSKTEIDDVTKTQDIVFFISKTKEGLEGARGTLGDVTLHQQGNELNQQRFI
jgi:ubiquinone/menaquinone biosynthesis C-methylase UbiE